MVKTFFTFLLMQERIINSNSRRNWDEVNATKEANEWNSCAAGDKCASGHFNLTRNVAWGLLNAHSNGHSCHSRQSVHPTPSIERDRNYVTNKIVQMNPGYLKVTKYDSRSLFSFKISQVSPQKSKIVTLEPSSGAFANWRESTFSLSPEQTKCYEDLSTPCFAVACPSGTSV